MVKYAEGAAGGLPRRGLPVHFGFRVLDKRYLYEQDDDT